MKSRVPVPTRPVPPSPVPSSGDRKRRLLAYRVLRSSVRPVVRAGRFRFRCVRRLAVGSHVRRCVRRLRVGSLCRSVCEIGRARGLRLVVGSLSCWCRARRRGGALARRGGRNVWGRGSGSNFLAGRCWWVVGVVLCPFVVADPLGAVLREVRHRRGGQQLALAGGFGAVTAGAVARAARDDVGVDRGGLPGFEVVVCSVASTGAGLPVHDITAPPACVSIADADRNDQGRVAVVGLALLLPVHLCLEAQVQEIGVIVDEFVSRAAIDGDLSHVSREHCHRNHDVHARVTSYQNRCTAGNNVVSRVGTGLGRAARDESVNLVDEPVIAFFVFED